MTDTADTTDTITVHRKYLPRPGWSLDLPDYETGRRIVAILERTRLLTKAERDPFIASLALRWTAPITGGAEMTNPIRPYCAHKEEPTMETETRHVDWEQMADLTAYLAHLAEATPGFDDATGEDKAAAIRIHDVLIEQQWPHLDVDGYPKEGSVGLDVALAASDWTFLERWFTNPERMGQWAMDAIGAPIAPTETRRMHWDDEGSLFNELQWLVEGRHPYEERSEDDRKLAQDLINRNIGDTHPEPGGLSDEEYETLDQDTIDDLEAQQATVAITWPAEDWATADRLLAGVELVAGYRFAELRPCRGGAGDPDGNSADIDAAPAPVDSASPERWFIWETVEVLLDELGWLGRRADRVVLPDGAPRGLTADEARSAIAARDALLDQLPNTPADDETPFPVAMSAETWELIDALCAGVDFGWGVGVVGMSKEAAQ